ncbi:hypothetical protein EIP86_001915 [Pleurotus ostreatoroseus]|nr:hypothetical protein EIP86_001915 [Pleurotus ostreatoroseus]
MASPICQVPFLGLICSVPSPSDRETRVSHPLHSYATPYDPLPIYDGTTIVQLVAEASAASMLSAEIRKAEVTTTNLITTIKFSDLQGRQHILEILADILRHSKTVGKTLNALGVRINRVADSVYAVNDYIYQRLKKPMSISTIFSLRWAVQWAIPVPLGPDPLVLAFESAMTALVRDIEDIMIQCEACEALLAQLEDSLISLHEVSLLQLELGAKERSAILAQWWTKLGGNRDLLVANKARGKVLMELNQYRQTASGRVSTSIQAVQALTEDMADLRARVSSPSISRGSIPLEVQIRHIESGLERLKVGGRHAPFRHNPF